MLQRKTITKRQKKERARKRFGLALLFIGLIFVSISIFYIAFLEKPGPITSPLSKDQVSGTAKINKILKEKNISYKDISTSKDLYYVIKLSDKEEVIIDPKKNIEEQLSSLQFILSQLKIEGKTFKRLDFRYQKPIISF
ncbi:MAG: hypothetical protein AAB520_01680 [Patescibacteria group bacterium]